MSRNASQWEYLKRLLHHSSIYFGAASVILVLVLPVFLGVSEYLQYFLYFVGVGAFYFAGYQAWKESQPTSGEEPLTVKADTGVITFSSGTGNIVKKSKLRIRLSISNNTDSSIAIDNLRITLTDDSSWLRLKGKPTLSWGSGAPVGDCAEIGPKESKILDVNLDGETEEGDRVKLANAFRRLPVVPALLEAEYFYAGERASIEMDCTFDGEKLIERMRSSWRRSRLNDALQELERSG